MCLVVATTQYGQITTANPNENPSGCKCQSDSTIQRTSRKGREKEEGKPIEIEGVKEWEVEKILNKKKNKKVVRQVSSVMEGIHG